MKVESRKVLVFATLLLFVFQCSCASVDWWLTTLDKNTVLQQQSSPSISQGGVSNNNFQMNVNSDTTHQNMYGFGAALTQSSAYVLQRYKQANSDGYQKLLRTLFDKNEGAGFSVLRLPITACDMVPGGFYTYDDTPGDYGLDHESLQPDMNGTIPVLKDILAINPDIKIVASPWSAPVWMKTSNSWFSGTLADYNTYSKYLAKVVALYKAQGINFYALTLQNEPYNTQQAYPVMGMSPENEQGLAIMLGQLLEQQGNSDVKLIVWDHNWDHPEYPISVYQNSTAYKYVHGSAFHCYAGTVDQQTTTHNAYPDKELWFTECTGTGQSNFGPNLAWNTQNLFIGAPANWAAMVIYWNLALDENFGPHNGGCSNCRPVVTIASDNSWIAFNEEYYGMAMFTKFFKYGGPPPRRVDVSINGGWGCVFGIAFKNNDGSVLTTVLNNCQTQQWAAIQNTQNGQTSYIQQNIPVGVSSFIWHP